MEKTILTASEVSKAFLLFSQPEIGDGITNLKLQKLLYYTQGFYLALNDGKPFFSDSILAWEHGPVVGEVYSQYKTYGSQLIDRPEEKSKLSNDQLDYIKRIWNIFGQFSAWKLRDMTHQESPWIDTKQSKEITHKKMTDFFITKLENK
ncbi:MAG: SocA family protein [Candidatus Moranbacteria bacterium]|nr:SocA family protein [Candidatus Moranbacteria bacterium]